MFTTVHTTIYDFVYCFEFGLLFRFYGVGICMQATAHGLLMCVLICVLICVLTCVLICAYTRSHHARKHAKAPSTAGVMDLGFRILGLGVSVWIIFIVFVWIIHNFTKKTLCVWITFL